MTATYFNLCMRAWCMLGCLVWPDQLGREKKGSSTVQILVYTGLDTTHVHVVLLCGNLN